MHINLGKKLRLRRLIDEKGAMLTVPMDHGYTLGPVKGLTNIKSTVDQVFQGGASSVVVHKGMVRSIASVLPAYKGLLVHVSGSTSLSPSANRKIITGTVSEVSSMGADGISTHVNVGADSDFQMLGDLANITEEAEILGIPVLAMMYIRNSEGKEKRDPDSIAHAARLAEEIGADIVKVNSTVDGENFDLITQGVNIPVIIAGGSKTDDFGSFLNTIKKCIIAGASGVSVGRNIFQADDPKLAMSKVRETVHMAIKEVGGIELFS